MLFLKILLCPICFKIIWRIEQNYIMMTALEFLHLQFQCICSHYIDLLNMLVLPWYIRFAIDTAIIATPFIYLHNHPTTHLFEYFEDKRRVARRRSIETQNRLWGEKQNPYFTKEEAQKFYGELGMKYQ